MPGLENDSLYFFRIQGVSPWGKSEKSEVLAGVAGESNPGVIIINGFDAVKTENTRDFVRQHADAFFRNGVHPVSASNDAMTAGLLNLTEYPVVDFIIGSDIYLNESVSPDEQELLKTYLQNGGRLFISGNDLAFDMDSKAKDNDQDFCYNYLKLKYFSRSPLDQKSVYYQVNLFDNAGIQDTFFFDNGEHGTYDVSRPDAIKPINGSLPFLVFTGIDTSHGMAGVAFNGIFPSGNTNGRVVATSIPLETIYPASARAKFISSVLNFYAQPDQIEKNVSLSVNHFELKQNYPNPFNPKTHINYQLPVASEIDLSIFDILGQKVATLVSGKQPAGKYQVEWDASVNLGPREGLASGFYLCRLSTSSGYTATRKLLLIK